MTVAAVTVRRRRFGGQKSILDYVSAARPLVGGVARGAPFFGVSLPDDAQEELLDLVGGAAEDFSDGSSSDEEIVPPAPRL